MSILIKNGRVINPLTNMDEIADILIRDGKIAEIGSINQGADTVIDAENMVVTTGFIDPHVHLRDPGFTHKEDIITGAKAAAAGGFTAVACMPNTKPPIDNIETIEYILKKAENCGVRVYPIACITKSMNGDELCDYETLIKAGAKGITDDGHPVKNAKLMQEAMAKAKELNIPILSHCEDMDIIGKGIINKGKISEELGVLGMDRTSEDSVTAREIAIAAATNTAVHICHVSTKGSVELIRDARARGVEVSGETAPHYLHFTDKELLKKDAFYRMNPPLREEYDQKALIEGIKDGTINIIATDHAPHATEEKADFLKAPNGIIGLETSFGASYTALVKEGHITLNKLIEMMSINPAKLLNVEGGDISKGKKADLTILSLEDWLVTKENIYSKSENTPFIGKTLTGRIEYTIMNGNITFKR